MKTLICSTCLVCLLLICADSGLVRAQDAANVPVNASLPDAVPAAQKYAADEPVPASNGSEYVIGPENALQIDVYYGKGERLSQKVRVSSHGAINFPLVGEVQVAGLTVTGLQERLTHLLAQDYLVNPQVTAYIEEYSTVSIMGEVRKPGVYPIKGRLTVVELLSLAEGFTKIASPNKVKVLRTRPDGTREEIMVKVADLMNKDTGDKDNVVLRSGDVVVVPESLF